eukprot:scaffold37711_cov112-Skeletonema_marinoi.AAC.1
MRPAKSPMYDAFSWEKVARSARFHDLVALAIKTHAGGVFRPSHHITYYHRFSLSQHHLADSKISSSIKVNNNNIMASFEANNPPLPAVAPLYHPQMVVNNSGHQQFHQHQHQQQHQPPPTTLSAPPNFQMGGPNGLTITAPWGDMNHIHNTSGAAEARQQFLSNAAATVVSNSSSNSTPNNSTSTNTVDPLHLQQQPQPPRVSTTSILLPPSQQPRSARGDAVTHPVPEFLCHLFSIVTDPALSHLISWSVPTNNEQDNCGGGMQNVGKVVVHNPQGLQDYVLGKYYRHSRYSSFQRQLNYFGFKKKLHGGKKGKLCPCSYVHEGLGAEPSSLFTLKRRLRASSAGGRAAKNKNNSGGNDEDGGKKKLS